MKKLDKTIIIGIGNNGRQDDGLGWLFLDFLQEQDPSLNLEYRYQLQIEDAELITDYEHVIFVDATKELTEDGFYLKPCLPSEAHGFSTHALLPETVMHLNQKLFNKNPKASVMGIQGFDWELQIGLSDRAKSNLVKAQKYFSETFLN